MQQQTRTIRRPEVQAKTGLGATTIYNLEKSGAFPRHFMLTPRCAVWVEAEIDLWLEQRRAASIPAAQYPDVSMRKVSRGRRAAPPAPAPDPVYQALRGGRAASQDGGASRGRTGRNRLGG